MSVNNSIIFTVCPSIFANIRGKMIEIAFAALFTDTARDVFSNERPVVSSILFHKLQERFIL